MHRVRVKICGITRLEDAVAAAASGADAIGLVFYPGSPRCIDTDTAAAIISVLPPFISKVGLFVNQNASEIESILRQVSLDYLQFHGEESPDECGRYNKPYIKSMRMEEKIRLTAEVKKYHGSSSLLLDAHVTGMAGGTGQTFDWSRIPASLNKPIILAGGLTPGNVKTAITSVRPYGVDVSSGVEKSKGIKDPEKIASFIREVLTACLP